MELTDRIQELEERLRFLEIENQQLQKESAKANPLAFPAIKEKEIELMNSEARYRALADASNEAVFFMENALCIDVNGTALRMFGYTEEEVIGMYALSIIDETYHVETLHNLENNYPKPYVSLGVHKDGRKFPIRIHGRTFISNGQKTRITTIRDISKEKEKELALLESQAQLAMINQNLEEKFKKAIAISREKDHMIIQQSRQAVLGEMIGNIAHQWRQPLNDVSILINDLEDAYNFGVLNKEYFSKTIEIVYKRLKYMSDTINDFRKMHTDDFKKEAFKPKELIEKLIRFSEGSIKMNNIQIKLICTDNFEVLGYPNMLSHVLLNLLNNSRDILLDRHIKKPKISIKIELAGDRYSICVLDNGKGIDDEFIDKIFDPYFTTKDIKRGSGLGLFMAKSIVEKQMKGLMQVQNQTEGAEFTITLDTKMKAE